MPKQSKNQQLHLKKTTRFERLEWYLSPESAAGLCYRCPSTVRRWINGHEIDRACHELMLLKVFGVIPVKGWEHYRLTPEGLKMPSGDVVDPERLEMSGIYFSIMRDIQEQNRALLAEIRQLKRDRLKEELTGQ